MVLRQGEEGRLVLPRHSCMVDSRAHLSRLFRAVQGDLEGPGAQLEQKDKTKSKQKEIRKTLAHQSRKLINVRKLERVSIECRKTKTEVITLANQKGRRHPVNQSKLKVITRCRHEARENLHARAAIGLGFTCNWLKKWRENFEPITV